MMKELISGIHGVVVKTPNKGSESHGFELCIGKWSPVALQFRVQESESMLAELQKIFIQRDYGNGTFKERPSCMVRKRSAGVIV